MEDLHLGQLFAHTHELHRGAGHRPDGEGRTATGIAVHLGQHHTGQAQTFVEGLRHGHGILTGHGVGHEQDLLRVHRGLDGGQFLHQGLVHMQTAGGVQQDYRGLLLTGGFHGLAGDIHGIHVHRGRETGHVQLLGQHGQLVDGGGAVHVGRHQIGTHLLLAQQIGDLARRSGLTGALQAHQHDDRRLLALQVQARGLATKQAHQFLMNDLDDLLRRADALDEFLPQALLADVLHKVLDDLEVDVGLQKGKAHLAQAGLDIFFRQLAASAEGAEHTGKAIGKAFEHGNPAIKLH